MTNLIDKRLQLRILKKNNKFKYRFQVLSLKSGKYIHIIALLLLLYFSFRYFTINIQNNDNDYNDTMMNVNFDNNTSYSVKNHLDLSENNYLEKYRKMPTRVRPIPNKVLNNI